ncbi:MAG TPA: hypothetical protein VIK78_05400 [Ruminiclostridium sp.]
MITIKDEMKSLLCDLGVFSKQRCTDDENNQFYKMKKQKQQLPEGVYPYEQIYGYYRLVKTDLTDAEINRLIMLKQTQYLYSIKSSMIFFVALSVIAIILSLIR